jgi:hypothetical protein
MSCACLVTLASTLTEILATLYVRTFGFTQSNFNDDEEVLFKFGIDLGVHSFQGLALF